MAIADAQSVLASVAQRDIRPCRIALTLSVSHNVRSEAVEAAERLGGLLVGDGFEIDQPTVPGMLPALALSPGCAPLSRSLQLTTDGVAMRMLPVLGTPFANPLHPLVGISALTGAPAYLSVWPRSLKSPTDGTQGGSIMWRRVGPLHCEPWVCSVAIDTAVAADVSAVCARAACSAHPELLGIANSDQS